MSSLLRGHAKLIIISILAYVLPKWAWNDYLLKVWRIRLHKSEICSSKYTIWCSIDKTSVSSVIQSCPTLCDPMGWSVPAPPCPLPTPRAYSNSCPVSWWCHSTISSSVIPFSSHLQSFPASGSFPMSQFLTRWPKYWSFSFSISCSNEYSGLISFRMDWLDLLAVQGTLKSLLQHHSSKASILWRTAFFTVQLSHPYIGKK